MGIVAGSLKSVHKVDACRLGTVDLLVSFCHRNDKPVQVRLPPLSTVFLLAGVLSDIGVPLAEGKEIRNEKKGSKKKETTYRGI